MLTSMTGATWGPWRYRRCPLADSFLCFGYCGRENATQWSGSNYIVQDVCNEQKIYTTAYTNHKLHADQHDNASAGGLIPKLLEDGVVLITLPSSNDLGNPNK